MPKPRVHVWMMFLGWRVALEGEAHHSPMMTTVVLADVPTRREATGIAKAVRAALRLAKKTGGG